MQSIGQRIGRKDERIPIRRQCRDFLGIELQSTDRFQSHLLGVRRCEGDEMEHHHRVRAGILVDRALPGRPRKENADKRNREKLQPPEPPKHDECAPAILLPPSEQLLRFHGSLFATHSNSVFNARSFFTVGGLPPARENSYGFAFGRRVWKGAAITVDGSQNRIRGNVNGNILAPLPSERTPTATDPAVRSFIQRVLDAYPNAAPNRPDINGRMLNTNAPQRINDDAFSVRLDQSASARDTVTMRHAFTT